MTANVLSEIDRAIERYHLRGHPFCRKWQAGTLSQKKLHVYATQYYRHVEAFPECLMNLAMRTEGRLRDMVLANLSEELDRTDPHPKLWREFAAAVGVTEESLWQTPALPGVDALVRAYRTICRGRPVVEGVAALYAYEAQVPEIATTKIAALRDYYGVTSEEGLAYFRVHEEADKVHRAAWREWLGEAAQAESPMGRRNLLATAETALGALWEALDEIDGAAL